MIKQNYNGNSTRLGQLTTWLAVLEDIVRRVRSATLTAIAKVNKKKDEKDRKETVHEYEPVGSLQSSIS